MATLTPTTELDAVNIMLATIGEAPINDLSASGLGDVAAAKAVLHSTSRSVQTAGWHFNTEIDYELSPSVDGFLLLPSNQLRVDTVGNSRDIDVVVRGDKLYNRKEHTYVFTEPVTVEMIIFLAFTDLPEAARNYITVRAARKFQSNVLGSELIAAFSQEDEVDALITMKDAEGDTADHNMLTGSYSVANILVR